MRIDNRFRGIMICRDARGRRVQRIVGSDDARSLPKKGDAVDVDGEPMTVVAYIPPTRVVVEVDLEPDGKDRAMIRYHPASGRWGYMIYRWRKGEPVLVQGWRDGCGGFTEALQAAFEAYGSL